MTTATATKPVRLVERAAATGNFSDRIDRAAKMIRGVKIVGLKSSNSAASLGDGFKGSHEGYEYSPDALKQAIPLYEGVRVNLDHPATVPGPNGRRAVEAHKVADRFGQLRNVHFKDGEGLYGDLEYIQSHPATEQVLEMAERLPHTLALSHNAQGRPERKDGRVVVTKIHKVHSVDLIGEDGGTNKSLFESKMKPPEMKTKADHIHAGFKAKIQEVVSDNKTSTAEKIKRIRQLLRVEEELLDGMTRKVADTTSAPSTGQSEDAGLEPGSNPGAKNRAPSGSVTAPAAAAVRENRVFANKGGAKLLEALHGSGSRLTNQVRGTSGQLTKALGIGRGADFVQKLKLRRS